MTTTIHFSGLHHAACLLATPGSVRPLTGRHAGSLLTGWLGVGQVGLAHSAHPLGNSNLFHGVTSNPKVSSLPWRDQCLVRLGVPRGLRMGASIDCNILLVPPDACSTPPHRSHTIA
jgi:hypothetical protein